MEEDMMKKTVHFEKRFSQCAGGLVKFFWSTVLKGTSHSGGGF